VTWLVELLTLGPFVHVPRVLYHGGPPRRSVTRGWASWPQERKMAAAVEHAAQCLEILARLPPGDGETRYALVFVCMLRALLRARLVRGMPRIEPPRRHDDLTILAALLGRALGLPPMEAPDLAAVTQSPAPRRLTASLILADLRRLREAGMDGAAASRQEALALDPGRGTADAEADAVQPEGRRSVHQRSALEVAEEAARHAPHDLRRLLDLAVLLTKAREYDRAAEVVRQVLDADPHVSEAQHCLAVILRKQQRYSDAIVAAQRALELAPDSLATRTLLDKLQNRVRPKTPKLPPAQG
jgi:hypothetical protein